MRPFSIKNHVKGEWLITKVILRVTYTAVPGSNLVSSGKKSTSSFSGNLPFLNLFGVSTLRERKYDQMVILR